MVVAPFALGNLGCTGNKNRLVDCPVTTSDSVSATFDYGAGIFDYATFAYFDRFTNSDTCDPFSAGGGNFARVVCGTSTSAGELARFENPMLTSAGLRVVTKE